MHRKLFGNHFLSNKSPLTVTGTMIGDEKMLYEVAGKGDVREKTELETQLGRAREDREQVMIIPAYLFFCKVRSIKDIHQNKVC